MGHKNPTQSKRKWKRKEKVIGSWPGTCIQYTRLHYEHLLSASSRGKYCLALFRAVLGIPSLIIIYLSAFLTQLQCEKFSEFSRWSACLRLFQILRIMRWFSVVSFPALIKRPSRQTGAQKATSQVACLSEDLKCWKTWDITCGHKAKDITALTARRREALKEALTIFLERTRESHRQSDEHWNRFKGNVGETSEKRVGAHMGFSERKHTILNWTELISSLTSVLTADRSPGGEINVHRRERVRPSSLQGQKGQKGQKESKSCGQMNTGTSCFKGRRRKRLGNGVERTISGLFRTLRYH